MKVLGRQRLSARVWRRVRILQLLDDGWTLADTAAAAGTYPREVRRVGQRFLRGGLSEALGEDARPKQARMLDARKEVAIVAMVCAPPPPGRSRWMTTLIAEEAMRRKVVAKVGRETIRRMLTRHELKPWRRPRGRAEGARPLEPRDHRCGLRPQRAGGLPGGAGASAHLWPARPGFRSQNRSAWGTGRDAGPNRESRRARTRGRSQWFRALQLVGETGFEPATPWSRRAAA